VSLVLERLVVAARRERHNRGATMESALGKTVQVISQMTGLGTMGSFLLIGLILLFILFKIIDKA
jgi:hypothetical protein